MKRILVFGMVLGTALASYSEVSVGLNLLVQSTSDMRKIQNNQNVSTESGTNTVVLGIHPMLIIPVGEIIEIAPYAGYSYYHQTNTAGDIIVNENGDGGFDLGCGLYFRVVKGELLRFSIGPRLSYGMSFPRESESFSLGTALGVPANIDLCFTDRFFVRASPVLVEYAYNYTWENENSSRHRTSFSMITENGLSIGFFFTF